MVKVGESTSPRTSWFAT